MEKQSKMSTAINWSEKIEEIGGAYTGNRKGWLSRVATRAGISFRMAKGLYYGECVNPKHAVASRVLTAAEQAHIREARKDALKVAEHLNRYAQTLAEIDPDFHGPEIDALVTIARRFGSSDRT